MPAQVQLGQVCRHVSGRAGLDKVLSRLAAGGAVAVWDPEAENEGDVIFAGARLRPEAFRFLLTEVCGHPTVPCAPAVLDRLDIGPIPGSGDRQGTAFHIPVDLATALLLAGTDIAMELDINPEWVQADVAATPGAALVAVVPGQTQPSDRYLLGWTRDFVTVDAPG